jgi:hypothetical protein
MKAQRTESKGQFAAKLSALEKEKEQVSGNLSQMERHMKKLEEDLGRLAVMEESLQAKAHALSRETGEEVPRTKHLLRLYRNISNIQWQGEETSIAGRTFNSFLITAICPSSPIQSTDVTLLHDVRPFSLEPSKHSKSAVANLLWDLMDEVPAPLVHSQ